MPESLASALSDKQHHLYGFTHFAAAADVIDASILDSVFVIMDRAAVEAAWPHFVERWPEEARALFGRATQTSIESGVAAAELLAGLSLVEHSKED
jgi:hypothetical protein